jgi:glucosamine-6-phosphate deaminase
MIVAENLKVEVFPTRDAMGRAAASHVREELLSILERQQKARVVFAAAPSQNEFLASLVSIPDIPWERIEAFHMDEYIGVARDSPQSFGQFLRIHLFDRVAFGRVEFIDPSVRDPEGECVRYARLLAERPVDLICMGIGENGHIAFNDPPVADFSDPLPLKIVELDGPCRAQQVHDGSFAHIEHVPRFAITLTVPTLFAARKLSAVVPGPRKAHAVYETVKGPLGTACPASILRKHPSARLYLDFDSAALLQASDTDL